MCYYLSIQAPVESYSTAVKRQGRKRSEEYDIIYLLYYNKLNGCQKEQEAVQNVCQTTSDVFMSY